MNMNTNTINYYVFIYYIYKNNIQIYNYKYITKFMNENYLFYIL